jgi:hypothetical protein
MKKVQSKNIRLSDDARRVAWMLGEAGSEGLLCILATLKAEVGEVDGIVERCIEAITELVGKKLARLVLRSSKGMEQSWPVEGCPETSTRSALFAFFEPELFGKVARKWTGDEVELHVDLTKRELIYGTGISQD